MLPQQTKNIFSNTIQEQYNLIPKIRVIIRKRPLSQKELLKSDTDIIEIRNQNKVIVKELKQKVDLTKYIEEHPFIFDNAFDQNTTNEEIYISTIRPMIEAAFNKTKVTCFAYGQTGSGKTFTMMGSSNKIPGMYLLASYDIFSLLQNNKYNGFTIWISFYEIYCGKLFDLLNERNILTAREDGKQNIIIVGLTEKKVLNLNNLMSLIEYGLKVRTVGITGANSDSSRSHGIIQINIKDINNNIYGKISFIDLAGSERAADTINTNKQTKFDGAEINKSLLALKECIRALDQEKKHTPFRGSKLTLVLRDSFIGNCKTLMIANISPALSCSEHTLNTLRYADRVKELRGKNDIRIGEGNINLNYNNCNNNDFGNCNYEDLANLMYMPRKHGISVKYDVDSNLKKISARKTFRKGKKIEIKKSYGKNNGLDDSNWENIKGLNCNLFNNFPSINENSNFGSLFLGNNVNNYNNNVENVINQQQSYNNNLQNNNMNNNINNTINTNINNNINNTINTNINNNINNLLNNDMNKNYNLENNFIQIGNNSLMNLNNPFINPSKIISEEHYNNNTNDNEENNTISQNINQDINSNKNQWNLNNNNLIQINKQNQIQKNENIIKENLFNQKIDIKLNQNSLFENKENLQLNNITLQKQQSNIYNQFEENITNENNNIISKNNQNQENDTFTFLNEYIGFNNQKKQNLNENELSKLKDQYETLVNSILTEGKNYIENHKLHIDEMVKDIKNEMNLINSVETKSNIEEYITNLLNIFNSEELKIKNMKSKLINFKQMLKEENELGEKINILTKDDLNKNNENTLSDIKSIENNEIININFNNEENINKEDS